MGLAPFFTVQSLRLINAGISKHPSLLSLCIFTAGARGGHAVSIPRTNANLRVFRRIANRILSSSEDEGEDSEAWSDVSDEEQTAGVGSADEKSEVEDDGSDDENIRYTLPELVIPTAPLPTQQVTYACLQLVMLRLR